MNQRLTILTGITMAGLGVTLGAFGAHAFKTTLVATGRLETYELAVRYQFYHAFALLFTGLLMNFIELRSLQHAAICFAVGIVFFSGSLYLLCYTGITTFGAITPIGGTLFIIGWVMLFVAAYKKLKPHARL